MPSAMAVSYRGDTGEIQGRYRGDTVEIQGRYAHLREALLEHVVGVGEQQLPHLGRLGLGFGQGFGLGLGLGLG